MNVLEKSTMLATLGLFCFLTASNMASAKAVEFFGIHLTAGFFTYPFVYLFSSVIMATRPPDVYFKCITFAYFAYLSFISLMYIAATLPGVNAESNYSQSFDLVYNLSNYRVYLASLCAYFVSMLSFGVLFNSLKIDSVATKITLATFFVALADVNLFLLLAFWGVKDSNLLFDIMFWASIKKLVAQLILLGPTILVINLIRNRNEYCVSN
ncbi:queuosine precursor transporter [Vibrio sp. NH-UV-68]|uniref:queuosine precursor transporter n=1 Tax=unclassified Vibrio TaxID=2614977 RepID=UPI0036F34658